MPRKPKRKKNQAVTTKGPREVGSVTVKEWQRMPRQLLKEYCQKQKRPNPFFPQAKVKEGVKGFRKRAVLPDVSGKKEKEISVVAVEVFKTNQLATEHAALLALFHLDPRLPLQRKLPEPFATSWKSMSSDTPCMTIQNKFATGAERSEHQAAKRQQDNQRKHRQEESMKQFATVFMSEDNRKFVEDILTALQGPDVSSHASSGKGEVATPQTSVAVTDVAVVEENAEVKALRQELAKMGFQDKDTLIGAKEAISGGDGDVQSALDWLLLNVPEYRLPQQFDPRGRQMEITSNQESQLPALSVFLGNAVMGFPSKLAKAVMTDAIKAHPDGGPGALDMAMSQLYRGLYGTPLPKKPDLEAAREEREDELAALEAIFNTDFQPLCLDAALPGSGWKIAIRREGKEEAEPLGYFLCYVWPDCAYPFELPAWAIQSDALNARDRMHLVRCLAVRIREGDLFGQAMTWELVSWLQHNWDKALSSPRHPEPVAWTQFRRTGAGGLSAAQKTKLATRQKQIESAHTDETNSQDKPSKRGDKRSNNNRNNRVPTAAERKSLSAQLLRENQAAHKESNFKSMLANRGSLPAFKQRKKILDMVKDNQVVVISGETGCGKSTQVPQLVLEDAIEAGIGGDVRIVCTQPRRISAVGLAERVSQERSERCGHTVGYRIRLESKVSRATRLTYVTTGILLRQLAGGGLGDITHVVIDEVHERSLDTDFLLLILKRLMQEGCPVKLVLMSATLNSASFSTYFGQAPTLHIPGRTFPVVDFFLEDLLEETGYAPPRHMWRNLKQEDEEAELDSLAQLLPRGGVKYSDKTMAAAVGTDQSRLDLNLAHDAVFHLLDKYDRGGILVFLPGVGEINRLCSQLTRTAGAKGIERGLWIIPLHGSLATSNQQRVFAKCPRGVRKIVVATNIAETSITVNDVICVIDSGRMKQTEYDAQRKLSMLVDTWVSQANGTQRKGRAGRVQKGFCYRLFSRLVWSRLPAHQKPEIQRTALEHLCLQIKLLGMQQQAVARKNKGQKKGGWGIKAVLNAALEPPEPRAVEAALHTLKELKALKKNVKQPGLRLTALGHHLANLPVGNVRLGKVLLYGALLGVTSAVAKIAALLSARSPFMSPKDARPQAEAARNELATGYLAKSDHLVLLKALNGWIEARRSGRGSSRSYCEQYFLKETALEQSMQLADSFIRSLAETGFVNGRRGPPRNMASLDAVYDRNDSSSQLISAALAAGLYCNIIKVRHPDQVYMQTVHGAVPISNSAKELKYYIRAREDADAPPNHHQGAPNSTVPPQNRPGWVPQERVFLHPSSINFTSCSYESPWLLYLQLMQTSRVYAFDSAMVMPYALLLFGGEVSVDHKRGLIAVDEWIRFKAPGRIAVLVRQLRRHLDQHLEHKVKDPSFDLVGSPVVEAMLRLLTTNGF